MKIASSEHVVYINCSECQNKNEKQFVYTTYSELAIFMYWTGNSTNNLSSYCGLVSLKKLRSNFLVDSLQISVENRIYFTDWTVHITLAIVLPSLLICLIVYFLWRRRNNARNKKLRTSQCPLEEQTALEEMVNKHNPERNVETIIANDTDEVYG